jgi:transposase
MRIPAHIKPWLSVEKMFGWLQNAPNEASYKRRMAIWLTYTGKLHAPKVAEILGVSTPSIWQWVRQYNTYGPKGLERKGRGGRRWGFMSLHEESELLKPMMKKASLSNPLKATQIKLLVEKKLGRKVSKPYIYRMLSRHGWYDKIAQSRLPAKHSIHHDDFQAISRPWLRQD